jgi:ubiquinone/menaquinone biosynthesis C-methylase UbiE
MGLSDISLQARRTAARMRNRIANSSGGSRLWELWWQSYQYFNRREASECGGTVPCDHVHRELILNAVAEAMPIASVLEVGCGLGFNLEILHRRFPEMRLSGIDINTRFVAAARDRFVALSIPAEFARARTDRLRGFADKSVDLVLTDAVLLYTGPGRIRAALLELMRVCRRQLLLFEFGVATEAEAPPWRPYAGRWAYDYVRLLKECDPVMRVAMARIPRRAWNDQGWQTHGCIIQACVSGAGCLS